MKIKVLVSTTVESIIEIEDYTNMNDEEVKQFCNDVMDGNEHKENPSDYNICWSDCSYRNYTIHRERE